MQANELFTQPNTILLDGGMGTMLQAAGLKLGARPEELDITDPQLIESIHSRYAAAGRNYRGGHRQLQAGLRPLRRTGRAGRRPAGRTAGAQRHAGL